jgi:effector-binding domain-containing protein
VFGINTVEEARYDLLIDEDNYELRLYRPMVVAETYIEGDFDKAGDQAFRKLFGYISGENVSSSEIAMTAPVIASASETDKGTEIDMTAPVLQERTEQGWRYMFVLPASYSIQTAPEPLHEDVKLSSQPQKQVAVIRYSGSWDENAIAEKTNKLKQWIAANDLLPASEPRWAGYNPPWTLPFLRRNEVMIDVN